jgi:hypothetical protein
MIPKGLTVAAYILVGLSPVVTTLFGCASLQVLDPTEPASQPNYGPILASQISNSFRDFSKRTGSTYTEFELSGLRWVQAPTGWNWLACVRFRDDGRLRWYAFFIDGKGSIINARQALLIDACAEQTYVPFDVARGKIGQPSPLAPLRPPY